MTIHRVELPAPGIEELRAEAFTEGFDFIERLIKEWSSGENRFDAPGETAESFCNSAGVAPFVACGGSGGSATAVRPTQPASNSATTSAASRAARLAWQRGLAVPLHIAARRSLSCVERSTARPNDSELRRVSQPAISNNVAT